MDATVWADAVVLGLQAEMVHEASSGSRISCGMDDRLHHHGSHMLDYVARDEKSVNPAGEGTAKYWRRPGILDAPGRSAGVAETTEPLRQYGRQE